MTIQGPSIDDVEAACGAYRNKSPVYGTCPICGLKDTSCFHQKIANVLRAISGGLLPRYREKEIDEDGGVTADVVPKPLVLV